MDGRLQPHGAAERLRGTNALRSAKQIREIQKVFPRWEKLGARDKRECLSEAGASVSAQVRRVDEQGLPKERNARYGLL